MSPIGVAGRGVGCRRLLRAGQRVALLAEHRDRLFPAALFADLFPSVQGRPSIPGEVIASVIVLQALYGHSDREAVDALTFDLRWKAALRVRDRREGLRSLDVEPLAAPTGGNDRPQRIFRGVVRAR